MLLGHKTTNKQYSNTGLLLIIKNGLIKVIYVAVGDTALPNYLQSEMLIPSELNISFKWREVLEDYNDKIIVDYLEFGGP